MKQELTDVQRRGLKQLFNDERFGSVHSGAIGRAGTGLVKKGLAERIGYTIYAGNYRNKCIPEAWIKFKLTEKGRKLAKELFAS
ncbi:MAG: hypothetical protein AB2792_23020 [Candidatus Thiodiazotropha sp.]